MKFIMYTFIGILFLSFVYTALDTFNFLESNDKAILDNEITSEISKCSKEEISKKYPESTFIKYDPHNDDNFKELGNDYYSFSGDISTVNVFGRELQETFMCRVNLLESQCKEVVCLYY